jgi:UDP-N-acetylglucosamine pyrophosphorylase
MYFSYICIASPKHLFSVDHAILQHMVDSQAEFIMEVTDKTKADIKVTI